MYTTKRQQHVLDLHRKLYRKHYRVVHYTENPNTIYTKHLRQPKVRTTHARSFRMFHTTTAAWIQPTVSAVKTNKFPNQGDRTCSPRSIINRQHHKFHPYWVLKARIYSEPINLRTKKQTREQKNSSWRIVGITKENLRETTSNNCAGQNCPAMNPLGRVERILTACALQKKGGAFRAGCTVETLQDLN